MFNDSRPPIHELSFFQAITRPSFVRFLVAFVLMILIVLTCYLYFGVYKKEANELDAFAVYVENGLRNKAKIDTDVYGGATPRETLDMFILALEAGDPDLAAMYFIDDDYGSREKWHKVMIDTYNAGKFPMIVEVLRRAQPEPDGIIGDTFYSFSVYDEGGDLVVDVGLIFMGRKIWKINGV
ncbi:MAG: hypothetical protein COU10_03275 [Candidatus Harrisonbacteria bacterium CG10_big_fil_rev_8_21_14_0_10_45_28]|uniref:DUF4878 domain-containing protein n=1 Tax=Candidatus Harrisonbacteria bacterium CG10_big_fil_rev_8_21_14_0_10_45_28 TaxID=1974586 RepID=A0A2H0UMM0_9BACT|nr:MAG: hypothetical protein COU10_03275 [Candidatus Harrisonbacteria bacterium CG10_big_fil_rev_8_21_14_0_10_45_28]